MRREYFNSLRTHAQYLKFVFFVFTYSDRMLEFITLPWLANRHFCASLTFRVASSSSSSSVVGLWSVLSHCSFVAVACFVSHMLYELASVQTSACVCVRARSLYAKNVQGTGYIVLTDGPPPCILSNADDCRITNMYISNECEMRFEQKKNKIDCTHI